MIESNGATPSPFHSHVFLGEGHEKSERKTWAVIWLCGAMMIAEVVGGLLFGSIALVADGMHMRRMQARSCSQRSLIPTPASMPMILTSRSAPASSGTSPGLPAPSSLR